VKRYVVVGSFAVVIVLAVGMGLVFMNSAPRTLGETSSMQVLLKSEDWLADADLAGRQFSLCGPDRARFARILEHSVLDNAPKKWAVAGTVLCRFDSGQGVLVVFSEACDLCIVECEKGDTLDQNQRVYALSKVPLVSFLAGCKGYTDQGPATTEGKPKN
jgi:hypothetical protein